MAPVNVSGLGPFPFGRPSMALGVGQLLRATTTSLNGRAFFPSVSSDALPDLQSLEVGVGHVGYATTSFRLPQKLPGQAGSRVSRSRLNRGGRALPASTVCGVGNNPDAISAVRGANGGSWNTVPDRIVPERGQVSENGSHPERKQA